MPVEVILPKVDMDMATGKISRWFVKEGAAVRQGEVLFEIETDKAAMEIDAPASGVIRDITGEEGIDIAVGSPVAWIYGAGEAAKSTASSSLRVGREAEGEAGGAKGSAPSAAPAQSADLPAPADGLARPSSLHKGKDGSVRATPLARRIARQRDIDLATIAGSGPHGRVVRADVEASAFEAPALRTSSPQDEGGLRDLTATHQDPGAAGSQSPHPEVQAEQASKDGGETLRLFEPDSYELIPHDNMRRTIARRLAEAKSTIPHFYLAADCELDALLAMRSRLNAAAPMRKTDKGEAPSYKLSVHDMVVKAMAMALTAVPDANVSWSESALLRHAHADVGVAVSIPGGLITPIIRKADQKSLSAISSEIKELAGRARERKLKPEEYRGGTTAVSNLGMFGVKDFAAIINPPHATILAVGAGEQRAVVKNGKVEIATIMSVTLSIDHRAVDGALGADLVAAFKRLIENPLAMLV